MMDHNPNIETLDELEEAVYQFNSRNFSESSLMPIMGGGEKPNLEAMFVFINPTRRDQPSDPL